MRRGNTRMKHKVFSSILLGYFFVMIALGYSSARVIRGQKGIIDVAGNISMFIQKGAVDPIGAAHVRKLGKKLIAHEDEASRDANNAKGAQRGGTSKFSGKNEDALKKFIGSLQEQEMSEQKKHMTMIAPRALKFTSFVIPRNSISYTNSKHSQDSNPEPQGNTTQEDESQILVEASKEIMNLIHKDYKGAARRRTPIHNQEPRN